MCKSPRLIGRFVMGTLLCSVLFSFELHAAGTPSFANEKALMAYSKKIPESKWPLFDEYRVSDQLQQFRRYRALGINLSGRRTLSEQEATWAGSEDRWAIFLPDVKTIEVAALEALTKNQVMIFRLGITELTKELALILAKMKSERIELPALRSVSIEAIEPLLKWQSTTWGYKTNSISRVHLGIESLTDPQVARAIASSTWDGVGFPNLKEVSPEALKELVTFNGSRMALSVAGATPSVMQALGDWGGGNLTLLGNGPVNPASIQALAKWQGSWITFRGLKHISPAALQAFDGQRLSLSFVSLEEIGPKTASAFASIKGHMEVYMSGIRTLTAKTIKAMAKPGTVRFEFPNLRKMTLPAAKALKVYMDARMSRDKRVELNDISLKVPCRTQAIQTLLTHAWPSIKCRPLAPHER